MVLERYEEERYALTSIDPVDAIALKMAEFGWSQKGFGNCAGSASRASEILNRKRALSIEHIRVLHRELKIPAGVLIGQSQPSDTFTDGGPARKLPLKEMIRRGWLGSQSLDAQGPWHRSKTFSHRVSLGATPVFVRRSVYGGIDERV